MWNNPWRITWTHWKTWRSARVFPQGMCHNWWLSPALKHVVPEQKIWDGSDRSRDSQCYCGVWPMVTYKRFTVHLCNGSLKGNIRLWHMATWLPYSLHLLFTYSSYFCWIWKLSNCAEQSDFVSTCKSSCRGVPDIARGFTRFHQP